MEGYPSALLLAAIALLLGNPTVSSVIAGATKTEQVAANAKAAEDIKEIDEVLRSGD